MHDLLSPGQSLAVLFVPIQQPLSLVLSVVEKADGLRVLLLLNRAVRDPGHPFATHPVIRWLRDIKTVSAFRARLPAQDSA